jgi:hypothetical protein
MPLYFVKQDNTIWGCGESGCCGSYYEDITVAFVQMPKNEPVTADTILSKIGGGPILKFRAATMKELQAYIDGRNEGYTIGYEDRSRYEKLIKNAT